MTLPDGTTPAATLKDVRGRAPGISVGATSPTHRRPRNLSACLSLAYANEAQIRVCGKCKTERVFAEQAKARINALLQGRVALDMDIRERWVSSNRRRST